LLEKVKSNMQEVRARGGDLFEFTDADSNFGESEGVHVIRTQRHVGVLSPIVHTIPVQLLAYHTALARGTDVDKPRNLAKAVTVEQRARRLVAAAAASASATPATGRRLALDRAGVHREPRARQAGGAL